MKRNILILLTIGLNICHASAQDLAGEPIVDKPCPNFTFGTVDFYKNDKVSLADFKGKWLVMDFWSKDCSGCIGSFPSVNKKQKELKDSLQFLMVTYIDKENINRRLYTRYHKALGLTMPAAYDGTFDLQTGNSTGIWKQFNIGLLPHWVIIDPKGIVRAVTSTASLAKLEDLMQGKNVAFDPPSYGNDKQEAGKYKYNYDRPYLINGNGGDDSVFLYRSLLSRWTKKGPVRVDGKLVTEHRPGSCEELGVDLFRLYRLAYMGEGSDPAHDSPLYGGFNPYPILEIRDSSRFMTDNYSRAIEDNYFCYSLSVPREKATTKYMMSIMRADLKNYFGYEVTVEMRKVPYWRLVVTDMLKAKKLLTKGGPEKITPIGVSDTFYSDGLSYRNIPMSQLTLMAAIYSGLVYTHSPTRGTIEEALLDETGLGNIDIDISWVKNDAKGVLADLRRHGLDIVKGEKEMKCIVIRDPRQDTANP